MSFNPTGGVAAPQEVFGSWVTEMSPESLPSGCSPDNQDIVFTPGNLSSRPCLQKRLPQFPGSPNVLYGKSFVANDGTVKNLYLTSDGKFWVGTEDDSAPTAIYFTNPGNVAKSSTILGAEYIAISDGLHGADVPLVYDPQHGLFRATQDGPGVPPTVSTLSIAPTTLTGLVRSADIVTATTSTAHGLLVGYQAQISGTTASIVGTSISSIVINNESQPGLGLVTTSTAHGLAPDEIINISGVTNTTVGSAWSVVVLAGLATATSATPHGLSVGAEILVQTTGGPVLPFTVYQVISTTEVSWIDAGTPGTYAGGVVQLVWPLSNATLEENNFTVQTVPSATTFYISISYSDGTWTGGTVTLAWDGTYYVISVPSATTFTYQQYGPNATYTTPGTVTPYGQAAPGIHYVRCSLTTVEGYVTRPSPAAMVDLPGGQYVSVTNIPVGLSGIQSVNIEFTGASGSFFFYIPVPAQINGQIVSTSTVVPNGTTSAVFDFSDNTLFAATATSIPGNNTPNQIVLDGALGFGAYEGRAVTWGQRNLVQNFLNMTFTGGFLQGSSVPTGWTYVGPSGGLGTVTNGIYVAPLWTVAPSGAGTFAVLTQPAYVDSYGAPIIQPNTQYTVRAKVETSNCELVVSLSSVSTSFSSTVSLISTTTSPGYAQGNLSLVTPNSIPKDLILTVSCVATAAGVFDLQELEFIYTSAPYLETIFHGSYEDNPQAFDGVSGKFGAATDIAKIMDFSTIRGNFYWLTQEPSGRLHEVADNGVTEPAGWNVNEVASNCGLLSPFALTKSQADDSSASGGEEWFAWASLSGARIFSGGDVTKISQEIQPSWYEQDEVDGNPWEQINLGAALKVWAMNDPIERRIYFGLPLGTSPLPSIIYPLSYRELDTAYAIANSPPYHPSLSGKLVSTDNTRKWTRWNMTMTGCSRMYHNGVMAATFWGIGHGNVYTLNPAYLTDDDYGQVNPYWISHFGPTHDQEAAFQLDAGIKQISYLTALISGVGTVTITVLCNTLSSPWPLTCTRDLIETPLWDLEWGGGYAKAQRMAFKIQSSPLAGETDNYFALSQLIPWFSRARLLVRGAAQ